MSLDCVVFGGGVVVGFVGVGVVRAAQAAVVLPRLMWALVMVREDRNKTKTQLRRNKEGARYMLERYVFRLVMRELNSDVGKRKQHLIYISSDSSNFNNIGGGNAGKCMSLILIVR
jgi:hypothetical protein